MVFQEGDLVQHKAGGPTMCIEGFDTSDKYAYCSWFLNGSNQSAQFAIACLKPFKQESLEVKKFSESSRFLYDARPGEDVSQAADMCQNYGCAGFVFNGIIVRVENGGSISRMAKKYDKQINK